MVDIVSASKNIFDDIKAIIKRNIYYYRINPRNALFFLTYRCTSQCKTCNIWRMGRLDDPKKELGLEDWKKVINEISCLGVESIEFFGGDALLRKDILIPLIEYSNKKGIETFFPTNCNLLDEEIAYSLVDAGLGTIYISVDGIDTVHDRVRGVEGTFNRVVNAVNHMKRARGNKKQPAIVFNTTVSSINVDHFHEILSFAEEIGVDSVKFEYVAEFSNESIKKSNINGLRPTPFYSSLNSSVLLNRKQANLFKEKLETIHKLPQRMNISTKNVDMLTIDNLINGVFPNKKCYIACSQVTVDPFGNIMPCPFFHNYFIGNMNNESFQSIWNNKKHRDFLKLQREKKIDLCNHCNMGFYRTSLFQSIVKIFLSITKKGRI